MTGEIFPHLQHFIWDQTLGREYSKWFGRPVRWLPTAVDPQALNPEMAQHSSRKFEPVDVCFLGEYYSIPFTDAASDAEAYRFPTPEIVVDVVVTYVVLIISMNTTSVMIKAMRSATPLSVDSKQ